KVTITLLPLNKKLRVNRGVPLMDVLYEYGVEFPCGSKGTCGRCRIKLIKGELYTDTVHAKKLVQTGLDSTTRLACYCKADSDVVIEISQFENIILADS